MLRVGIDVGGTNTDAALLRGNDVLATAKALTSADVLSGCTASLQAALLKAGTQPCDVQAVMVGTTHFINALVTQSGLTKCALLRLCGGATGDLPPFIDLVSTVAINVGTYSAMLPGGMHYDGVPISEVDPAAVQRAVEEAIAAGAGAIVVSGIFSPVSDRQEEQACKAVAEKLGVLGRQDVLITKSSDVAGLGILERENAAVLNASLRPLAQRVVAAARSAVHECGCGGASLFLTQNDGTVIAGSEAVKLPIKCVQCGPVNSLRGAALLAKVSEAIVVDVGGTSTDVGAIVAGFPRPASCDAFIGQVRTNFPVPDVSSIGLGGGSYVSGADVGPASVGKDLPTQCLACGGPVCTATDVAIRLRRGPDGFGSVEHVAPKLSEQEAEIAWKAIQAKVSKAVDRCKLVAGDVHVVLVGGGAFLVEDALPGASEVFRPVHAESANAVGAAAAQVSGSVDAVVQLGGASDRDTVLGELQQRALERAVAAGAAAGSAKILEVDQTPLAYLPGGACRVRVRAVGDLASLQAAPAASVLAGVQAGEGGLGAKRLEPPRSAPGAEAKRPRVESRGRAEASAAAEGAREARPGEWLLSEEDIDAITLGVGVLGTGGGGSPHRTRLALVRAIRTHGPPVVVQPEDLPDDCLVFEAGYMGAPTVGVELLRSGQATKAVRALAEHVGRTPDFVITGEIGGGNGLEQLSLAIELGVPAVDGDFMGRAFPCLDHTTTAIYGLGVAPAALADHLGNVVIMPRVASARWLEDILRPVCTAMGCTAGLAMKPLTGAEVKKVCIKRTLSHAFKIGSAVLRARRAHQDPVAAAAEAGGGEMIFQGKVMSVHRFTSAGFARGEATLQADGSRLKIDFQNENLIASSGGRVVATTPELICILETATGRPLQTEEVRYGLLVSVLLLPAPELMRKPEALAVVGPRGFGYDLDFVPHSARKKP